MDVQKTFNAGQPVDIRKLQAQQHLRSAPGAPPANAASQVSFGDVLARKIDGLKFSAHAETRLASRNIALTPELMGKLEKAIAGAARKGSRDSLIMTRECAFIVNIPNRTVVTAMDGASMKENIFTNIDSAVIAD
ncbi:MAG: flagellar protein [Chitinispirillaceae bacterium]|nr:flagellar protein [Chitinispirillaceae bacterium]